MAHVLITQCLQFDFVKPIGKFEPLPNQLHVGYEEARRLLGDKPEEGPVCRTLEWAYSRSPEDLALIHIRDWHDSDSADQASHLHQFGSHCLRNTEGARFVFPEKPRKNVSVVDSLTLNDFQGTKLEEALKPFEKVPARVGLIGVWTEAKISYLAYELRTRYPNFEIGVCSALTASSSRAHHFMALDQLQRLLGVRVFSSLGEFLQFLGGQKTDLPVPEFSSATPLLKFDSPVTLKETDTRLLRYLFRDAKNARFRVLDGGFSGNVVVGSESEDLFGHSQVPHVVKIGPQPLIGKERAAFERVESVLGNNAPHIADFADFGDRGAIKYRYAAMGGGFSSTFQKLYMQGLPEEKVRKFLSAVFSEQLGRFYRAALFEKGNLLEYYQFDPKWAGSVRRKIEDITGEKADGEQVRVHASCIVPNLALFYEKELAKCLPLGEGSSYFSYVHGDLNGANIIVDAQENVWLIDFFHTHRGHILRDLIKLENDVLYIFTKVDEETWEEAIRFTEELLKVEDLAAPLPENHFASTEFQKAWGTLRILRSFYPPLVQTNRDPLQLWIALLRYAAHTLSFDESSLLQKKWALYAGSRYAEKIILGLAKKGPLRVDWLALVRTKPGRLGITMLPGRKDYGRSVEADLKKLQAEGVTHVVCLLPLPELKNYGVEHLLEEYRRQGIVCKHLPIVDQKVSSQEEMRECVRWISELMKDGKTVVLHCVAGIGRSGLVAACYLKSQGVSAAEAVSEVRQARSQRCVESAEQEIFVNEFYL